VDLSDARCDSIVHLLYEAVARSAAWTDFFTSLGEAVGASAIHLVALDKQHGALSYSDGFNLPTDGELAYIQKYGKIDPRTALILQNDIE
jgi:hypothetical protein